MITVDWGNYEETILVLRVNDAFAEYDCKLTSLKYRAMLTQSSSRVDLILDIRLAGSMLAKVARFLNYEIENRLPNLNKIVVLGTKEQERTMQLIANFYPRFVSEIIVVDTVEDAYNRVFVA